MSWFRKKPPAEPQVHMLDIRQADILVFEFPGQLTDAQFKRLKANVKDALGERFQELDRVLVLENGATVKVLREEQEELPTTEGASDGLPAGLDPRDSSGSRTPRAD